MIDITIEYLSPQKEGKSGELRGLLTGELLNLVILSLHEDGSRSRGALFKHCSIKVSG